MLTQTKRSLIHIISCYLAGLFHVNIFPIKEATTANHFGKAVMSVCLEMMRIKYQLNPLRETQFILAAS